MGVLFVDAKGEPLVLIQGSSDPPRLVRVGIDAAVVAQHEVCVRATDAQGRVRIERFRVQPTLAGLRSLSSRLAEMPGVVAVAEPTSMTWLGCRWRCVTRAAICRCWGPGMRRGCVGRSAANTRVM